MCPDRIVPRRTSTASRTNWRKAALVTGGWWVVAIEDRQSDFPRSARLTFENLDELACVRSLIALEGVGGRLVGQITLSTDLHDFDVSCPSEFFDHPLEKTLDGLFFQEPSVGWVPAWRRPQDSWLHMRSRRPGCMLGQTWRCFLQWPIELP